MGEMEAATVEEFITAAQAAQIVHATTRYLAELRFNGTGPKFIKPSPRKVLYRRSDVIAWLDSHERTITDRESA